MTETEDIVCKMESLGKPTIFDIEVANESVKLHYKMMKPIMKAIKEM